MTPFSRRDLLKASTGLAAALALEPLTGCVPSESTEAELDVQFAHLTLAGYNLRLRTYGGAIPGPTLETKPGARLSVRVRNQLPPYDSSAWYEDLEGLSHTVRMNVPHDLNTTNLHVHGLEVVPHLFEPVGTSEPTAHMIAIKPGEEKHYEFTLPENHPSGLYWYHPHHHGSTAVQVQNGMAGLIVVRGPIDEVPEIAAAKEYFVALQDLGLFQSTDASGNVFWSYNPRQNAIYNTFSGTSHIVAADGTLGEQVDSGFSTGDFPLRLFLVNGSPVFEETHNAQNPTSPTSKQLSVPRYTLRPGEVVRFRMLNGFSDNMVPLVVEGHTMQLLALDGVNFLAPRARPAVANPVDGQEQVLLAPGGRAEFLIQGSTTPGVYRILQVAQSEQFLESAQKVLAEIEITGEPMDMALPTSLPTPTRHYPLIKASEVGTRRNMSFDMTFPAVLNKVVGLDFAMNGQMYDETQVPTEVKLGSVEEWTLQDDGHSTGSTEGHPFHLHTNSFEVVSIGGKPVEPGTIQDTVWVPHHVPVVIRIRFKEWVGKDVFHCHILPHEDAGMMQNLLVKR
jgi:FtsP/CotA-like multicopper oxidase with cupredoxin domain